jgi:hypothetical protein
MRRTDRMLLSLGILWTILGAAGGPWDPGCEGTARARKVFVKCG